MLLNILRILSSNLLKGELNHQSTFPYQLRHNCPYLGYNLEKFKCDSLATQYPSLQRRTTILIIFGDNLGGKVRWGDLLILKEFLVFGSFR